MALEACGLDCFSQGFFERAGTLGFGLASLQGGFTPFQEAFPPLIVALLGGAATAPFCSGVLGTAQSRGESACAALTLEQARYDGHFLLDAALVGFQLARALPLIHTRVVSLW